MIGWLMSPIGLGVVWTSIGVAAFALGLVATHALIYRGGIRAGGNHGMVPDAAYGMMFALLLWARLLPWILAAIFVGLTLLLTGAFGQWVAVVAGLGSAIASVAKVSRPQRIFSGHERAVVVAVAGLAAWSLSIALPSAVVPIATAIGAATLLGGIAIARAGLRPSDAALIASVARVGETIEHDDVMLRARGRSALPAIVALVNRDDRASATIPAWLPTHLRAIAGPAADAALARLLSRSESLETRRQALAALSVDVALDEHLRSTSELIALLPLLGVDDADAVARTLDRLPMESDGLAAAREFFGTMRAVEWYSERSPGMVLVRRLVTLGVPWTWEALVGANTTFRIVAPLVRLNPSASLAALEAIGRGDAGVITSTQSTAANDVATMRSRAIAWLQQLALSDEESWAIVAPFLRRACPETLEDPIAECARWLDVERGKLTAPLFTATDPRASLTLVDAYCTRIDTEASWSVLAALWSHAAFIVSYRGQLMIKATACLAEPHRFLGFFRHARAAPPGWLGRAAPERAILAQALLRRRYAHVARLDNTGTASAATPRSEEIVAQMLTRLPPKWVEVRAEMVETIGWALGGAEGVKTPRAS